MKNRLAILFLLSSLSACENTFEWDRDKNNPFYDSSSNAYGPYLSGKFSYLEGDFHTSSTYMQQALENNPDNLNIAHGAMIPLLLSGEVKKTEKIAQQLIGTNFEDEMVRIVYATHLIAQKKYKEAQIYFEKAKINKDDFGLVVPLLQLWLATAQKANFNTDKVYDLLSESTTPEIYHYHLGNLYQFRGDIEKAKDEYLNLLDAPQNLSFRETEIICAFLKKNEFKDNFQDFIKTLVQSQNDPFIYRHFVNKLENSTKPHSPLTSINQGIAEIYVQFASTLIDTSALDLGLVFLHLTQFLYPDFDLAQALMAKALSKRELYEDALNLSANIKPGSNYFPFFTLIEIENLIALDQSSKALNRIEELMKTTPNWAYLLAQKGQILTQEKHYHDAAQAFTSAILLMEKEPNAYKIMRDEQLANFYFQRGGAYERDKLWSLAEPDFEKSLALKPDQPLVLNYLGYSLVEMGINVAKGLKLIQDAVKLAPEESAFLDSLGWAYYKTGQYVEAKTYIEKALELTPNDADAHDHLGEIYKALGHETEARFEWRKALFFVTDPEQKKKLESKLTPPKESTLPQ